MSGSMYEYHDMIHEVILFVGVLCEMSTNAIGIGTFLIRIILS